MNGVTRRARAFAHRLQRRVRPEHGPDDEQFVAETFQELLDRPVDPAGRAYYCKLLAAGTSRAELRAMLIASDEYQNRIAAREFVLPDLVTAAPARYEDLVADDGAVVRTYRAASDEAFDWIEQQIVANGYYERPGIWSLGIDLDKRVMGELIAALEPRSAIEVGCSSGGVLFCLGEAGVDVCGVEISELARERADASIRDRIILGDIAEIDFGRSFDLAFGLDVFEHVHPAKLEEFITALVATVGEEGLLFANVPAFGHDEVFGEVFPMFLPQWREDAHTGKAFRHLQVDAFGYPAHGHLVWATTDWWVDRFERAGVRRAVAVERALHDRYDWYFESCAPARKSFYVFAKGEGRDLAGLANRIECEDTQVLAELRADLEATPS